VAPLVGRKGLDQPLIHPYIYLMRIILDVPDNHEAQVLAQMHALGYSAYAEAEEPLSNEILESHLALIREREKDPLLSETRSLKEVFAKYDSRQKF
jgi:hypothetical protein